MAIGTIWTYRDLIKREQGLEAAIEFEQVVKKYQAEQIAIEQERIIKLLEGLEQTAFDNYKANRTGEYGEGVCVGISGAIALIKGKK